MATWKCQFKIMAPSFPSVCSRLKACGEIGSEGVRPMASLWVNGFRGLSVSNTDLGMRLFFFFLQRVRTSPKDEPPLFS
jgi:hypothetical protein